MNPIEDIKLLQDLFERFNSEPPRNAERGPWLDAIWCCENWRKAISGATRLEADNPLFIAKSVTGLHAAAMAIGLMAGQGLIGPQEVDRLFDEYTENDREMKGPLSYWGPITLNVREHAEHMGVCCGTIALDQDQGVKHRMLTCSIANLFAVFYELGKLRPAPPQVIQ